MLSAVYRQFPRLPGSAKYVIETTEKILCVNLWVRSCVLSRHCVSGSYWFTKPNYMILHKHLIVVCDQSCEFSWCLSCNNYYFIRMFIYMLIFLFYIRLLFFTYLLLQLKCWKPSLSLFPEGKGQFKPLILSSELSVALMLCYPTFHFTEIMSVFCVFDFMNL